MKSRIKPALRVAPVGHVQLSIPVQGVLREVKHAFIGLCFDAGSRVLAALMEADREMLCGPKNRADAQRLAYRGGHVRGGVVLGGQRLAVKRPRVRALEAGEDTGEVALPSYVWAAARDPLDEATLHAIAAGVSTRRYASTLPAVPEPHETASSSRSAVSRRFVELSTAQVHEWLERPVPKDLIVVMIDGIYLGERVILVALGIDAKGVKHVLGLREGATENARVVKSLLSDLIARGLDAHARRLWVIDGAKALRSAIVELFGALAHIHRCQEHKRRNVIDHLPQAMQAGTSRAMRQAWDAGNASLAKRRLEALAGSLQAQHPGAASSLREGLDETLTLQALGITGALYRTLRTTNPIENLNGAIAHYTRNVRRWRDGEMVQRWVASALADAGQRFRKLRGHRDMKLLMAAMEAKAQSMKSAQRRAA